MKMKKLICCMVGAICAFSTSASNILSEEFGEGGFKFGRDAKKIPVERLLGKNCGTVLFDLIIADGSHNAMGCRRVMSLRTDGRLSFGFYSCDENRSLLCSFTDGTGEHTWRVALPPTVFGERVRLGLSWDGAFLRCFLNGRVYDMGVQPLPFSDVRNMYFGPFKDAWMVAAPWGNDIQLLNVRVFDEALKPEVVAEDAGLKIECVETTHPTVLTVPALPAGVDAPTVDGRLKSAAWRCAASLPQLLMGNHPENSGRIPEHGFSMIYDSQNLYLAFKSRFPGFTDVIAGQERKEGKEPALWGTESFEFRLEIDGHNYMFGGNVAGGFAEMKDGDGSWNGEWEYRTSREMNIDDTVLWKGEVAIPWATIGQKSPPKEFRMNFCRSWKLPNIGCHTSLNATGTGYDEVSHFAKVVLASAPTYELVERIDPAEGRYREKFRICTQERASVEYAVALASRDGRLPPMGGVRRTYSLKARDAVEDVIDFGISIPEYDVIVHTLTSDGIVVARQAVPFKLDDRFFSVIPYLLHERIVVKVKGAMLKSKHGGDFSGIIILADTQGKEYGRWPLVGEELNIPFFLAYPAGEYRVSLVNALTGEIVGAQSVRYPGIGDWAKQDFHPELIIPPFKPLTTRVESGECDVIRVAFSDRSYGWKDSLFLSAVISKGRKILSSPVEVLVDGKPLVAKTFKVGRNMPHRLEFSGTSDNAELSGWLEYDGVNFNKLKVMAPGKSLAIRYALSADSSKYMHGARGGAWGLKITDFVYEGVRKLPYYPVLWLCGEERGLAFFTETRRAWNGSEKECYTIEKKDGSAIITIDVMDKLPDAPFEFEFGFQATPIRPLARNHPFETFGETYGIELNRPGRVPTVGIALLNCDDAPYGDTASYFGDQDDASGNKTRIANEKMFALCQGHNEVRAMPYTAARWLSTRYPEVAAFLNDWKLVPELALDDNNNGHFMYDLCPTTKASDFWMWHFRKMLERHPQQRGIYCDFGTVKECANGVHGCKGAIPLLAYREFVRRLAVVQLDFHKDDPVVVLHNTDCNQVPCLSFASHLYNGENVRQASSSILHGKKDILDTYSLDMFACELSTLPLGVCNGPYFPFDCLSAKNGGDEEDAAYKFRMDKAAFAATLVHNHFPSQARNHFGLFDKVYRVYEDFGVGKTARFVGYWDAPATVDGNTNVYVSCYTDGTKVLAVVGHIGKEHEDKDVEIVFDLNALGVTGQLSHAIDMMTRPDPDYEWLSVAMKRAKVPVWRCPIDMGEFGTHIDGFDGTTLKYHLPFHAFGIVELMP